MDSRTRNNAYLELGDLYWLAALHPGGNRRQVPNDVFLRLARGGLVRRTLSGCVVTARGKRLRGEALSCPERWPHLSDDSAGQDDAEGFRAIAMERSSVFHGDPEDATTWNLH